jgi:putative sugar O-methyltransferase
MTNSDQARFLVRHSHPTTLLRCAASKTDLSNAAWSGTTWTRPDRWLYAFASRLIWDYARKCGDGRVLDLDEPLIGDPLPVRIGNRLISQDLANSSLEVEAILRTHCQRPPRSIVEIGAGYGRTAYALLSLFPDTTYTVIDIEPAIRISEYYLTRLFPNRNLRFITPDRIEQIEDGFASLAISISSLQEMTQTQVSSYLALLDRIVESNGFVYLKQWSEWTNLEDHVTMRFTDYPIPSRWKLNFRERCPIQTNFEQAVWQVGEVANAASTFTG